MIGLFITNKQKQVCFVQPAPDGEIVSFHYAATQHMMTLHLADGTEETFTSEIGPEIHASLLTTQKILVARFDGADKLEREYWADLTVG